jgi:hypothetical protein
LSLVSFILLAVSFVMCVGAIVFLSVRGRGPVEAGALVIIVIGAFGIAPTLAPTRAPAGFYSAAAQVVPVLLLALGLEVRLFRVRFLAGVGREDDERWGLYLSRLLVVAYLALFGPPGAAGEKESPEQRVTP